MQLARRWLDPEWWPFRWLMLLLASLMLFGAYFGYDSVGDIAVTLKDDLGFGGSKIGLLYSAYHVPNLAMPFIGGVLVDRLGGAKATLIFSVFVLVGSVVVALTPYFLVMMFGRFLFGIGAESLVVSQSALVGEWFRGKEIALAFGLCLMFARLGYFTALWILPRLAEKGYALAFWFTAGTCLASFVVAIWMAWLDRFGRDELKRKEKEREQQYEDDTALSAMTPLPPTVERRSFKQEWNQFVSQMRGISKAMWLVALISFTFYPSVLPFVSFGVDFLSSKYGYSETKAGNIISIISFITMFGTPFFGLLLDIFGHRILCMLSGFVVLIACYLLLAATPWNPIPMVAGVGIGYSLVPAAIWPSVVLVVENENLHGTAYGLTTAAYNIGLMIFPFVVGALKDLTDSYVLSDLTLALLAAVGIVWCIMLYFSKYRKALTAPSAKAAKVTEEVEWEEEEPISGKEVEEEWPPRRSSDGSRRDSLSSWPNGTAE